MIRIGILGDIGSGKSYVAKNFGYPVFNADSEVSKIYKKNKKIFNKLKKKLPRYISKFPIDKNEVSVAILSNKNNLKKIINIVHLEVRKQMKLFLNKNKNKKFVVLDIPLLLENKLNKKGDILVFVRSKKAKILKRLKKRKNYNLKIIEVLKQNQSKLLKKRKLAKYTIDNNYSANIMKAKIKILKESL
jgi:dephospho-CoA kinase